MVYYPSIALHEDVNFRLRAPKKGHLKLKKLYSAYEKHSLSSIPQKYEIYLLDKAKSAKSIIIQDEDKDFNSTYTKKHNTSSIQSKHIINISRKGYGNGFASNFDRFDPVKEYNDKYSPGPGEYVINRSNKKSEHHSNNSLRYESLFKDPFQMKVIVKRQDKLGPGFYSPNIQSCVVKNAKIPNSSFISQDVRFKEVKRKTLGPGSYDQINSTKWNTKKTSFFFKQSPIKHVNNLEKYINIRDLAKQSKDTTPGPGHYLKRREFDDCCSKDTKSLKKEKSHSSLMSSSQENCLVPKELKEFNTLIKDEMNLRQNMFLLNKMNKDVLVDMKQKEQKLTKEIRSPFISNSKKSIIYDYTANHLPGPCYYQKDIKYYNKMISKG